jgi:hypothetical protein
MADDDQADSAGAEGCGLEALQSGGLRGGLGEGRLEDLQRDCAGDLQEAIDVGRRRSVELSSNSEGGRTDQHGSEQVSHGLLRMQPVFHRNRRPKWLIYGEV